MDLMQANSEGPHAGAIKDNSKAYEAFRFRLDSRLQT